MALKKLSILIATMPSRVTHLFCLAGVLVPQLTEEVEVILDGSMDYNIGTKRNRLLAKASGEYVVFIDDDDSVSPEYVQLILGAIKSKPDCVGTSGVIAINGNIPKQWHISKVYKYWHESGGVYYRTPNHISPVRRELAVETGFADMSFGEDADYSKRLFPLLKTEVVIPDNIYNYIYFDK